MNKNDLIKKLENLDLPEVNLPSHQRRLKTALFNSGYWKEKTSMSIFKKFAPIGSIAVIALLVVAGVNYFKGSSSVSVNNLLLTPAAYAKELVTEAQKQLTDAKAMAAFSDPTTGIIQWKKPDADGNIRDEKDSIIFITDQEGKLVPAPYELSDQNKYWAENLEKTGGYPNALFNDMAKAKNTAYYYVVIKPVVLSREQISALRTAGVRMIQLANREEIEMLKNKGVGISDEKSVYSALIEEDKIEAVKQLPSVVSITLPPVKSDGGGVILDVGSSDENYTFTKDSFLSFLKEAENAKDLTYLGDKRVGDPAKPLSAVGRKIRILQFIDNKGNTTILGIDESNMPVVKIIYNDIDPNSPKPLELEEQIKYWTENLEQPTDFKAIQK